MNILITGASGLIGSALMQHPGFVEHRLLSLIRKSSVSVATEPHWDPDRGQIDLSPAGKLDAVIHLAGENIAQRWSSAAKQRIMESRINGTRLLCESLLRQSPLPKVLLCASATGFYGDRGDEILDEQKGPGNGFLAEVCERWEAATEPAARAGIRVVNLRFGVVLSRDGGALKKMLPIFRLGLGGRIASGKQYWSWIAIDDVASAIHFALVTEAIRGPINVVSPNPVRNAEFTKALAKALHRPAGFAVPAPIAKVALGQMGKEALLSSFRVAPVKLEQAGFRFQFPEISGAFEHSLRD